MKPKDGREVKVRRAMVLAAGLGLRMRSVTEALPKPLIEVAGWPLIDLVLDRLEAFGVERAVINLHHRGEMIVRHLESRRRPRLEFSHEEELLETGGGVARALSKLGRGPFFVANSDVFWFDGPTGALSRLARVWDGRAMDALLLLYPTVSAAAYRGAGDYFLDSLGLLRRKREHEVAPFLFMGVQMLHPRLFKGAPDGRFSLNLLYDRAEAAGRLFGVRHDGRWHHLGTPEGLAAAEAALGAGSDKRGRR